MDEEGSGSISGYINFWEKIKAEHDCEAYEFVAIKAWDAAQRHTAKRCKAITQQHYLAENQAVEIDEKISTEFDI